MRKRRNVTLKVGESALFHGGPNQEFQIVPREDGTLWILSTVIGTKPVVKRDSQFGHLVLRIEPMGP